jgi:amidase
LRRPAGRRGRQTCSTAITSPAAFSTAPAVAGYPHITVPAGFVYGLPVGLSFTGLAWTEPTLIKLAYAYEQATRHRRAPKFLPSVETI